MRHKVTTWRNIEGKVVNIEYEYTIAVRRFGMWRNLRLYPGRIDKEDVVSRCLCSKVVVFSYEGKGIRYATKFDNEADAIQVKLDIMQHPDKYVKS